MATARTVLAVLVAVALAGWGVWGRRAWRRLRVELALGHRGALTREYRLTMTGQLVLSIAALGAMGRAVFSVPARGALRHLLPAGASAGLLTGLGVGLASAAVGAVAARRRRGGEDASRGGPRPVGGVEDLVPVTPAERRLFTALCLVVGLCEELLYRGFAVRFLVDRGLHGWVVVLVAAAFFGLAHSYQGPAGVAATAVLGLLLTGLFLLTGSIWLAALVHALLDLRLLLLPRAVAVSPPDAAPA